MRWDYSAVGMRTALPTSCRNASFRGTKARILVPNENIRRSLKNHDPRLRGGQQYSQQNFFFAIYDFCHDFGADGGRSKSATWSWSNDFRYTWNGPRIGIGYLQFLFFDTSEFQKIAAHIVRLLLLSKNVVAGQSTESLPLDSGESTSWTIIISR